jgi:signal transduction histidine kinase/ActR/RegA family two-component response regulator
LTSLRSRIAEIVDGMDLSPEQRKEIRRRLETCLDAAERAGAAERDERIEALSTRVRQAEEQLAQAQKMEAIGRLTGGIAHDFNNLLTGILGYSSLLKTFLPENGQGYEAAAYIERSARRASELTRQLLAYSRRETPTFRPVDLRRVTGEAIEILSRSVNKNVEIHTDFHQPQEPVSGDAGTLVQALLNLGVNASDAMPGGGHLTFSTSPFVSGGEVYLNDVLVPEGRYVSICVADTGSGIPEEIRDEVFAPFFTTKAPGEGTGLGLSMVYSCVRTHGGFVRLVSSVGVGTTFQILLPVMEESGDADEPREPATEIPGGTETVLVVDDQEIPLNLLCDVLRSLGYTTLPAASGEEGIEILRYAPEKVDLVIVDRIMPGMDGVESLARLRAIRPTLRTILCSGTSEAERTPSGAVPDGFDDFLQKPYERETLARKVRSVLDARPSKK